jgi:gamma-glutamyltranspeptidase/glutathione hydrolase
MIRFATPASASRQVSAFARPAFRALALLVAAVGVGGAGCGGGKGPDAPKPAKLAPPGPEGIRFGVATENEEATRAALAVLADGGDAVDAAAAAAFVLGVATPSSCGIGGGGFATVWRAKEKKGYVLDFRETAPKAIEPKALDARPPAPDQRGVFVGVPGEVAGLSALVAKFGKRSFAKALEPAIALAERGFVMTPYVRRAVGTFAVALADEAPGFAQQVTDASGPLPAGTRVARPELAKTLRTLHDHGPRAFYEGAIAEAIVAAARAKGSTIALSDLHDYAPKWREPLRLSLTTASGAKREVLTMPPPSAGGLMLLETLESDALLRKKSGKGLDADALGSGAYLHHLAEIMRGALDDRLRFVGDPDILPVDTAALLADARLEKRLALYDPSATHAPAELRVDEHGTSHLSIIDAEGNSVALTTTVNNGFGARLLAGDTGILLNDELADFGKTTEHYDSKLQPPNEPVPGARPTSSMTPTIVLEDGAPIAIVGGSGGMSIATSVTIVMVGRLTFGLGPVEAVAQPRVNVFGRQLFVEDTLPPEVRVDLQKRGESLAPSLLPNAVQLVTVERTGAPAGQRIRVAADPRKGGVALAQ